MPLNDNTYRSIFSELKYAFRNDHFAVSMISSYLNKFAAYDADEQHRLCWDIEALTIDFEIYVAEFADMEVDFDNDDVCI